MVKDLDAAKADQMEKKILELWDRLCQAWMMSMSNENSNLIGPTVDITAAYSAWESFKETFKKTPLRKISYLRLICLDILVFYLSNVFISLTQNYLT